ncbi:MAG: hypothetical protein ACKVT0_12180, partial [Planctomycetaceae bacterium]
MCIFQFVAFGDGFHVISLVIVFELGVSWVRQFTCGLKSIFRDVEELHPTGEKKMIRFASVLIVVFTMVVTTTSAIAEPIMFWADQGKVFRGNRDGTDVQQIYTPTAGTGVEGVEVDQINQRLYLRGGVPSAGLIRSMNFDGSGLSDILTGLNYSAYGFALDVPNDRMYFGNHPDGIFTANLDGSNIQSLPGTSSGFDQLRHTHDIEVDSVASKVYYSNSEHAFISHFKGIRIADLNGSNVANIVDHGTTNTVAVMMALDNASDKIYWSEEVSGVIKRANLD